MAISKTRFTRGIILKPDDTGVDSIEGELKVGLTSKKLHAYLDGALRNVVLENTVATLTNKTFDANGTGNVLSNVEVADLAAGVLNVSTTLATASDLQLPSALAVKTYVDNKAATQDQASEIPFVPVGNIVATNVQTMGQELDADLSTEIARASAAEALIQTNLTTHINNATGAHAASAIANTPAGNLAATNQQAVNNELQSDIDAINADVADDVEGPASAVNEAIVRFDGTTGKLVKSGTGTISSAGVVSGVTQLNVDNVRLDGNTTSTTSGDLILKGDLNTAYAQLSMRDYNADLQGAFSSPLNPSTGLTGANAAGNFLYAKVYVVTVPLTSVDSIGFSQGTGAPLPGQEITILNSSGASFLINNDVGASGKRILTTTGANITVDIDQAVDLVYNSVSGKWIVRGFGIASAANLATHISDPTDAHAGSAIINTPSGNLAATTVQAALNELQTDVDTRATSAALTAHEADTTSIHGIADTSLLVTTTGTQTLSNKSFSDAVSLPELGSTPTNPSAGSQKIYMKADGKFYKLNSGGTETEVGSGTGGGGTGVSDPDSLLIQSFDASVLGDFTQTGLTFNTTAPLHGAQSAQLIHQAAINQSFKQTLAVDRKFRGQLNELSLNIRSTATDGNVTLLVTDETNAVTIAASQSVQTSSFAISATTTSASTTISGISNSDINLLSVGMAVSGAGIASNTVINSISTSAGTAVLSIAATASATVSLRISTLPIRRAFSFTIPSNCLSMSYTITALPEANSPRTTIDDLVLKLASTALLSTSVVVPVVTAWASYTPTYTGFGSVTDALQWRQNGQNVEVRGKFTSGTPTAVEARVGLPNGYTSATTGIIPSIQVIGTIGVNANASAYVALIEPSVTYLTMAQQVGTGSGALTKITGTTAGGSGSQFSILASIPVSGLSATTSTAIPLTQSGIITDGDSMIRLDTANGYGSTNTLIRRFTNVTQNIGADVLYQDSATLGGSFTIVTPGTYEITYVDGFSAANFFGISKNSTQLTTNIVSITIADRLSMGYVTSVDSNVVASWAGYLAAGDIIRCHVGTATSTTTASRSNFTIARQGSLKQVSVNTNSKIKIPTSELRFEGASTRGSTDTAIVKFDTLAKIRGDAFTVVSDAVSGTKITMLKAGKLEVSASIRHTTASAVFGISRNQQSLIATATASESLVVGVKNNAATDAFPLATGTFVNIGDVIRVFSDAALTAMTIASLNLSFQEQDIQVSVTNVLPTFTDVDSSVRVDTANGYGSTGTKIRRFSNVRDNIGVDVEYSDSATEGAKFVAKSSGIYNISYSDNSSVASETFGISKNASSLTTGIDSLISSEILATQQVDGTQDIRANISWQGFLTIGDIVRPHSRGGAVTTASNTTFTMSKVGKPIIASVDVTPFVNVPQPEVSEIRLEGSSSRGSVATTIVKFDNTVKHNNNGGFSVTNTAADGTFITILKNGQVNITAGVYGSAVDNITYLTKNQAVLTAIPTTAPEVLASQYVVSQRSVMPLSYSGTVSAGDVIRISSSQTPTANIFNNFNLLFTALSSQILTPPETFSTDTASLSYAGSATYTLATLTNAPVGTYITYTYAASTNTRTQTTTRPTQTDADMNANGMLIYTRAYNAASTAAQPTIFAIQIGKGLKGTSLNLYKSTAKSVAEAGLDFYTDGVVSQGARYKTYNEITGVLLVDAGVQDTTVTSSQFAFNDVSAQTSGYLVINASKNPSLVGIGLNRIAARAVSTSGQSITTTTTLVYDAVKTYDTHGALNASTGIFTAPETGYYSVQASVGFGSAAYTTAQGVYLEGMKNGARHSLGLFNRPFAAGTNIFSAVYSDSVFLAKGDTFYMAVTNERGATALQASAGYNNFAITKVSI